MTHYPARDEMETAEGGGVATAERPQAVENAREEDVVTPQHGERNLVRGMIRFLALPLAYALALAQTMLGFRLAFSLSGANPNNDFVDFIDQASDPLAEPFQGIIASETVDSGIFEQVTPGIFEPATVIAMAVYFAIGALLISLILVLTNGPAPRSARGVKEDQHLRTAAYRH